MRQGWLLYGLVLVGVVLGLITLVTGEAQGGKQSLVMGGGTLVIASVAGLSVLVDRL